ncbi:MAG: glycosyltransferase family 4 protein [Pseudobdellovibrio sp.]
MIKVLQETISTGYGGLELVIIEFHEWLINNNIEAYVIAVEGTPIEKHLIQRGYQNSILSVPKNDSKKIAGIKEKYDSLETAFIFHSHKGLKQLAFNSYEAKITALSHTFYNSKKRDLWHRFLFSKVDQWVALTARHKENLIATTAIPERKVCIIPNGVDLKKFKCFFKEIPGLNTPIKIGVVARLDKKKGQDVAIKAFKILVANSSRKWTLHFYGEDTPNEEPTRPALERLVSELNLTDLVFFEGYQENLATALSEMDVVWTPSLKETFGRCIIESMASGVPVIASNAGGVPDIIVNRKNGILFESGNEEDLFLKTIELIENPFLFRAIQMNARNDIEANYNIENIWSKLLQTISPASVNLKIQTQSS